MENAILNILSNVGQPSEMNRRISKSSEDFQNTFNGLINSRKGLDGMKRLSYSEVKSKKAFTASLSDKKLTRENPEKEKKLSAIDGNKEMVNILAKILNINPGDIVAMLKMSGNENFSMDSILNSDKVVEDISNLLGLNSKQQELLKQYVNLACDINTKNTNVDTLLMQDGKDAPDALEKINPQYSSQDNDSSSLQGSVNNASENALGKQPDTELSRLSSQLKQKIEALLANNKAKAIEESNMTEKQMDPVTNSHNLSMVEEQKLRGTREQNTLKAVNIDEAGLISTSESDADTEKVVDKLAKGDASESFQNDSSINGAKPEMEFIRSSSRLIQVSESNAHNGSEINAHIQALHASATYSGTDFSEITGSSIKTIDPYSSEILSQIVENASVFLDEGKSEMIMNLKPDNLGKLELRVITERGIVEANFLAESQQVKEIIESNMQLLKDALEKQGLNVQGFSVSVRQDSGQELDQSRNNAYSKQGGAHGRRFNYQNTSNASAVSSLSERLNPYSNEKSLINYIA